MRNQIDAAATARRRARVSELVKKARGLRELGRFDAAEELLREAMQEAPDEAEPTLAFARLAEMRRSWPEAAERWRAARMRFPDYLFSWLGEALSLEQLGRFDEAAATIRHAIALFPNEAQPTFDYARLLEKRQDWAEALACWRTASKRFPSLTTAYSGEARALIALERLDKAELLLRKLIRKFPDDCELNKLTEDCARLTQAHLGRSK